MNKELQNEYVKGLREEYSERKRDKVDELHDLDRSVKLPTEIFAFSFGIFGALVLGVGMCLAMRVIGSALSFALPLGVGIGCVGIGIAIANYFLYRKILKSRKRKYAAQILALSDELLND
ncbi:MAG: dihydropteridine reductase [Candidatus Gallimonas sp.]